MQQFRGYLACVANNGVTQHRSLLDATHTKNEGWAGYVSWSADGLLRLPSKKRGLQNEVQHLIGEEPEVKRARDRERQNEIYGERKSHGSCRRRFRARLAHVHHHDHAQVVVSPN